MLKYSTSAVRRIVAIIIIIIIIGLLADDAAHKNKELN
jgi:hypothetical protein